MSLGFIVLVPTFIVIISALTTRKVLFSLFLGVVSAGFIASNFDIIKSIKLITYRLLSQAGLVDLWFWTGQCDRLYLLIFLILLGILIEILTHTGGIHLYTQKIIKHIKDKRQAQKLSLAISPFFFLDDYLNSLMTGSIMRPVMDHFKFPRAKLAYFINSIGSSQAVLIPASSWIGMIIAQFEVMGVGKTGLFNFDPFYLYICMIPFLIYPIFSIFSVWYTVMRNISFGKMHLYELEAERTGNLFGGKQPLEEQQKNDEEKIHNSSMSDVMIPIITFFVTFIITLLYSGGLFKGAGVVKAFMNSNSTLALFIAGILALMVAISRFIFKKQGNLKTLAKISFRGFNLMKSGLMLIILSGALAAILRFDLDAGGYIAQLLSGLTSLVLLPLITFLIATLTSAGIGSSWGTISILLPLVFPLLSTFLVGQSGANIIFLIVPTIGAVVSGSIAGSHISPITDGTIISTLGARCYHMDHVQTQISYSIAPIVGASIAYLLVGYLNKYSVFIKFFVPVLVGLLICVTLIQLRQYKRKFN